MAAIPRVSPSSHAQAMYRYASSCAVAIATPEDDDARIARSNKAPTTLTASFFFFSSSCCCPSARAHSMYCVQTSRLPPRVASEGGTAANVVAGRASLTIDMRFDHAVDGEEVNRRILSLAAEDPGVSLTVEGGIIFPPLEATDRNRPLSARAVEIAKSMGREIGVEKSGGGSDGSYLSAMGLGVLDGLGVEGGGAHALHEHIRVDRLAVRAAYFTRLILELASEPR